MKQYKYDNIANFVLITGKLECLLFQCSVCKQFCLPRILPYCLLILCSLLYAWFLQKGTNSDPIKVFRIF